MLYCHFHSSNFQFSVVDRAVAAATAVDEWHAFDSPAPPPPPPSLTQPTTAKEKHVLLADCREYQFNTPALPRA